jgi:hypothetical protein
MNLSTPEGLNVGCLWARLSLVVRVSSNDITRIAGDLLDDRLYSNSSANLQRFATKGFVYNILTFRNVVDKSVVSPGYPFDVVQHGQST